MEKKRIILTILICVTLLVSGFFVYAVSNEDDVERAVTPDGTTVSFDAIEMQYTETHFHGVVVYENGNISSGQSVWEAFLSAVDNGKPSTVVLENNWTLDPSRISTEHYNEIKINYPYLFIQNLSFDGDTFTLSWVEDSNYYSYGYRYLVRFEDAFPPESVMYTSRVMYVLVNDNEVTWEQIYHGLVSSSIGHYIDHKVVYSNYIR